MNSFYKVVVVSLHENIHSSDQQPGQHNEGLEPHFSDLQATASQLALSAADQADLLQRRHQDTNTQLSPPEIKWYAEDPIERGPVIASISDPLLRNAIGVHAAHQAPQLGLALALGELDIKHVPDLLDTEPAAPIGPFPGWSEPNRIVSIDPWGHLVQKHFSEQLVAGYDIRPSIAITKAQLTIPELDGVLERDGTVVSERGSILVSKIAIDPVWYLPGVAERLGIAEDDLRMSIVDELGDGYSDQLLGRPDLKVFLPPQDGISVLLVGDTRKLGKSDTIITARAHDKFEPSDIHGSTDWPSRPYLVAAYEKAVQTAQNGGVGIMAYFRGFEGRGYGEVIQSLVLNAIEREHKPTDWLARNHALTAMITGSSDGRCHSLMTDVFHWMGVQHIDHWIGKGNGKVDALVESGIEVRSVEQPSPDQLSRYAAPGTRFAQNGSPNIVKALEPAKPAPHSSTTEFDSAPAINWHAKTVQERGPIISSRKFNGVRNVIGVHSNLYAIHWGLKTAIGEMPARHLPDLKNTEPVVEIGPFPAWSEHNRIVTLDPFGASVGSDFSEMIERGWPIQPSISVSNAKLYYPELKDVLKPDGVIVSPDGVINATKVVIDQVWYLPGMAERLGVTEKTLRHALYDANGGAYEGLVRNDGRDVFMPPIDAVTVFILGDPDKLGDGKTEVTARPHDKCDGSDVHGSDICTCRPYFVHAIEEGVQTAQGGGLGVFPYFRGREGRGLGEITKTLVYNARKRDPQGDTPERYFEHTSRVAGVEDARTQTFTSDIFHYLGITSINRLVSMSNMKHDALVASGISVGERVEIPAHRIPPDAQVEITAKRGSGYFGDAVAHDGSVLGRGYNDLKRLH